MNFFPSRVVEKKCGSNCVAWVNSAKHREKVSPVGFGEKGAAAGWVRGTGGGLGFITGADGFATSGPSLFTISGDELWVGQAVSNRRGRKWESRVGNFVLSLFDSWFWGICFGSTIAP